MLLVLYNKNKPFTGSVLDIDTVTVSENKTLFFYLLLQMQKKYFVLKKRPMTQEWDTIMLEQDISGGKVTYIMHTQLLTLFTK